MKGNLNLRNKQMKFQFNKVGVDVINNKRLRWLPFVRWGLFGIGCILVFFGAILLFDQPPKPERFVAAWALLVAGVVAILSSLAIGIIGKEMLARLREIDELKSKFQELEEKLAQK